MTLDAVMAWRNEAQQMSTDGEATPPLPRLRAEVNDGATAATARGPRPPEAASASTVVRREPRDAPADDPWCLTGWNMSPTAIETHALMPPARLEALVQGRVGRRLRDLRIIVRPNGIVLQGRASTYHAKQLAQHAVMDATDMPILANEIEVR